MPSQVVGKPLVAENDKVRCSATTKENTRCQLAKVATKATKKMETATPVRRMVTRSASAAK